MGGANSNHKSSKLIPVKVHSAALVSAAARSPAAAPCLSPAEIETTTHSVTCTIICWGENIVKLVFKRSSAHINILCR